MKLTLQLLLIIGILLGIILLLLALGFSDFLGTSPEKYEIWQNKPWRPFARMALAFILLSMTCVLGGALIKVGFRNR